MSFLSAFCAPILSSTFTSPSPTHLLCYQSPITYFQLIRRRSRSNILKATAANTPPPDPSSTSPSPEVRQLSLLAIPMTSGADVLFPGGNQLLTVDAERALSLVEENPPEFAFVCVDAWGNTDTVATLAVVDDLQIGGENPQATLLCTGISRLKLLEIDENRTKALVHPFYDETPNEHDITTLEKLEEKLISTMTNIVTLSIKVSDTADQQKQIALADTLKRVEAFCGKCEEEERKSLLQHWILELEPHRRREILSFVVIDLVSVSFMDRKGLLRSTNTSTRLQEAIKSLEPFVKELAAKGAIVSALGRDSTEDTEE